MDFHYGESALRIAIVTENFLPKVDGVTRTLARLLDYLQEQGHQAVLFGPEGGLTSYAGHEVVGTFGLPLYFYPGLSLNFFRPKMLRKIRSFDPDVVHYVDPIWLSAQAQPVIERALPDVVAVSSYHTNLARYAGMYGFGWLVSTMWALQRRLHGRCQATFCPSPSTREMLLAQGFDNVDLWPRGIDVQLYCPSKRSSALRETWSGGADKPEKVVITYVGRISHEKNIRLLVNAFEGLDDAAKKVDPTFPGCKLVLVGDGPARAALEKSCAGVNIDFAGYRSGDELARYYASSDIFGFPSHSETFGNVVLEAMASGLPVVGLEAEGVCDLICHGSTGYMLDVRGMAPTRVDPSSAESADIGQLLIPGSETFASATIAYRQLLLRLCLNAATRKEMSKKAVAYAATRSWKEAMECLIRGYHRAAFETRRRKALRLFSSLSRASSTSSLLSEASFIDVKVEDPPEHDGDLSSAISTARLLFGRPPIKGLLRRSARQAISKSISLRLQGSRTTYYELAAKRSEFYGWQIYCVCLVLALVWLIRDYVPVSLAVRA